MILKPFIVLLLAQCTLGSVNLLIPMHETNKLLGKLHSV